MNKANFVNVLFFIIIPLSLIVFTGCTPKMKDFPELQEKAASPAEKDRISAVEKIGKIKDADPNTVLPALYEVLGSDISANVRYAAVKSLTRLGFAEANDALIRALKEDKDPGVRAAAATGVYTLSKSANVLIAACQTDSSPHVRAACVLYLGRIGGSKAADEVKYRLKEDRASEVRAQAASALGEMKDLSSFALLKETAFKDDSAKVRNASVVAIGALPGKDSMQFLVQCLKMPNLQDSAVTAIQRHDRGGESTEAITSLLEIANASPRKVDERLVDIFLTSKDQRVKPYFRRYILHPRAKSEHIRIIIHSMRKAGDTSMVPQLISDFRSTSKSSVQINLAMALALYGDPRATDPLLCALQNRAKYSRNVPKHFVRALEVLNDPKALQYLCSMCCEESDRDLRRAACRASRSVVRNNWRSKLPDCPCWHK